MFINLHNLPPGHSMFTLLVGRIDDQMEWAEEVDVVLDPRPLGDRWIAAIVIERTRESIHGAYGPGIHVLGVVNQSNGDVLFNCRENGQVPLPLDIPTRLAETTEHPYDYLLNLARDEAAGLGGAEYRAWLLEVTE